MDAKKTIAEIELLEHLLMLSAKSAAPDIRLEGSEPEAR
jgi:hypothetical protein